MSPNLSSFLYSRVTVKPGHIADSYLSCIICRSRSGFAEMSAVALWRMWKPDMPGLGETGPTF